MRCFLRAKLHRIRVTASELDYVGSVAIGYELMNAAALEEGERVLIANLSNGERWETYAIADLESPRSFVLNGGGARLGLAGDRCVLMAFWYGAAAEKPPPRIVFCDDENTPSIQAEMLLESREVIS